jgi:hypothetical protein
LITAAPKPTDNLLAKIEANRRWVYSWILKLTWRWRRKHQVQPPPERQQDVRVVLNIGSKKHIVLQKKEIEDLALLRSMAMGSASSSSRQGLELLDDELIDPEVVALIWSQCVASSNG